MESVNIKELVNQLNKFQNYDISIKFEGMIESKIDIKLLETTENKDYLIMSYGEEKEIRLNLHQISKIEMQDNKTFIIRFDAMQIVKVVVK